MNTKIPPVFLEKIPVRSLCLRTQIWWFSGFLFWVPGFQVLSLHVRFYYINHWVQPPWEQMRYQMACLQIEIGPGRQQKDTTFGAAAKRRVIILARYTREVQSSKDIYVCIWGMGGHGGKEELIEGIGSKILDFKTLIAYNCVCIIWILRSKWCLKI